MLQLSVLVGVLYVVVVGDALLRPILDRLYDEELREEFSAKEELCQRLKTQHSLITK